MELLATPKCKKMNQVLFEAKKWGGAPNYTGFACKTGSWTVQKYHPEKQNAPKLTILRARIKKKISGEGAQPPPPVGRGTPPPTPHLLGASILAPAILPHLCSCKLTLKKPW